VGISETKKTSPPPLPLLNTKNRSHRNPSGIWPAIRPQEAEIKIPAKKVAKMWGKKVGWEGIVPLGAFPDGRSGECSTAEWGEIGSGKDKEPMGNINWFGIDFDSREVQNFSRSKNV
jgi:hypothetical protein